MSNELPAAIVTVRFDKQPLSGEQLAALVQQVIGQDERKARYTEERRFYDGDVVTFGQTSGYPFDHIRVTPTLDGLPYFRFEESYSEVKVTSHSWGGSVYMVGYGQDSVINAVKAFADEVTAAYQTALDRGEFPSYTKPQDNNDW